MTRNVRLTQTLCIFVDIEEFIKTCDISFPLNDEHSRIKSDTVQNFTFHRSIRRQRLDI